MPSMDVYINAVADPDQPEATFRALATLADEILDLKQFTMMASDEARGVARRIYTCLLYTSPSPRDQRGSRMPSSA